MTDPSYTHPYFDCFMESRQSTVEPTDFDIFLLNAILALPPPTVTTPTTTPATPHVEPSPPLSSASYHSSMNLPSQKSFFGHSVSSRPSSSKQPSGASHTSDKLFPTPLLKCPLASFETFCKKYKLSSSLVSALHYARRRKKNRMFQRITRNKRREHGAEEAKQHDDYESDDEGKCDAIDYEKVYAELVAGLSLSQ